jgi:cation transport protein ChaC
LVILGVGFKQGKHAAAMDIGYGSLMWRPGLSLCRKPTRAFSFTTVRVVIAPPGTEALPGLVPGDRGPCVGVAFQIAPSKWEATLAYLRERSRPSQVIWK